MPVITEYVIYLRCLYRGKTRERTNDVHRRRRPPPLLLPAATTIIATRVHDVYTIWREME